MESAGLDTTENAMKLSKWQATQKDFLEQTGLKRQGTRESVTGWGRSEAAKATGNARAFNNFADKIISAGKTSTGGSIVSVAPHVYDQAKVRSIKAEDVVSALTSPIKLDKIRKDNSQQFYGEYATSVMNVKTGKVVTTWGPTSRVVKKWKEGKTL